MGCYNYTHFVEDFAKRTLDNLAIIEESPINADRNEVTQLINSFLGLLVVPNERYKFSNRNHRCNESDLRRADSVSYRKIKNIISKIKEEKKFFSDYQREDLCPVSSFISHLRNAVCHSGNNALFFLPIEEKREIETIMFYDTDMAFRKPNEAIHQFCAELTLMQVREALCNISKLYVAVETKAAETAQESYNETVASYRNLFLEK